MEIQATFRPLLKNPIYAFAMLNIIVFSVIGSIVLGGYLEEVIKVVLS